MVMGVGPKAKERAKPKEAHVVCPGETVEMLEVKVVLVVMAGDGLQASQGGPKLGGAQRGPRGESRGAQRAQPPPLPDPALCAVPVRGGDGGAGHGGGGGGMCARGNLAVGGGGGPHSGPGFFYRCITYIF